MDSVRSRIWGLPSSFSQIHLLPNNFIAFLHHWANDDREKGFCFGAHTSANDFFVCKRVETFQILFRSVVKKFYQDIFLPSLASISVFFNEICVSVLLGTSYVWHTKYVYLLQLRKFSSYFCIWFLILGFTFISAHLFLHLNFAHLFFFNFHDHVF